VLAPDKVSVPVPALVMVTAEPLMMPVMLASPLLVMDKALLLAKPIAAAVKVAVLMVRPVTVLPTAPVKVVLPVVVVDKENAPLTVLLNRIAPVLLPVLSALMAVKVAAPL
jgi:hypothetical protein